MEINQFNLYDTFYNPPANTSTKFYIEIAPYPPEEKYTKNKCITFCLFCFEDKEGKYYDKRPRPVARILELDLWQERFDFF